MKKSFAVQTAALLLTVGLLAPDRQVRAQTPAETNPNPNPNPTPVSTAPTDSAPTEAAEGDKQVTQGTPAGEPVVVRPALRNPGSVPAAAPVRPVAGLTNTVSSSSELLGQIGWTRAEPQFLEVVPEVTIIDTNRIESKRGLLPRFRRSDRRGFGGFLTSFANLFNPMAPTSDGVAAKGEYWYDGDINARPLPAAFRDERFHEPQLEIHVFSLERTIREEPEPEPEPAPRSR